MYVRTDVITHRDKGRDQNRKERARGGIKNQAGGIQFQGILSLTFSNSASHEHSEHVTLLIKLASGLGDDRLNKSCHCSVKLMNSDIN